MPKMMLTFAVLAAIAVQFVGCASAPKIVPTGPCQDKPSAFLTGQDGKPNVAIFHCYRADNVVTYQARKLTDDEVKSVSAALTPAAAAAAKPAPKAKSAKAGK